MDQDLASILQQIADKEAKLTILDEERALLFQEIENLKGRLHALKQNTNTASNSSSQKKVSVTSAFSTSAEKIALFKDLFQGREDVYPKRWVNRKKNTKGYSPACGNEWSRGVCNKPKVKCGVCPNQAFIPATENTIRDHLLGRHDIGVYPMLQDETCRFLAVDFDKGEWKGDVTAFVETCRTNNIPCAVERSRSGNGAHVWFFFDTAIPATTARKMGCYLITETMSNHHKLPMSSYDRLFPNQDTMPRGGFGNLIALPFQDEPRRSGNSVFIDENWDPFPDQWAYLASIVRIPASTADALAEEATKSDQVIGVRRAESPDDEESDAPWRRLPSRKQPAPVGFDHKLIVKHTDFQLSSTDSALSIQEIYRRLFQDEQRNRLILEDLLQALDEGRSPILPTERRDHLEYFAEKLQAVTRNIILLSGGMKTKDRRAAVERLTSIPETEERLVIATGRFIGEGFDDARLDTLFLTAPVSWKGTLVQYAGRLHRKHHAKTEVRVMDYVDHKVPMLARMFEKRMRGYRAMGYTVGEYSPAVEFGRELLIEYDQDVLENAGDDDSVR